MKATELMIGDWVAVQESNTCANKDPKIIQVTDILEDGINAYYCGGELDDYTEETLIEPIPLTLDILKAFGFEIDEEREEFSIYYNKDGEIVFGFDYDNENKDFYVSVGYFCNAVFSYVHELQHLLRLCGLNQLADNLVG